MNNNNNSKNTKEISNINLIGNDAHKDFLLIQTEFGVAQRGGAYPFNITSSHVTRLTNNVNFLTSTERKRLVFSGTIFNN